jgi:hypothetical protein
MTPEPSKGTPDRIRGDGGLGEAVGYDLHEDGVPVDVWSCTAASFTFDAVTRTRMVEVVPAARLAAAEQRAEKWAAGFMAPPQWADEIAARGGLPSVRLKPYARRRARFLLAESNTRMLTGLIRGAVWPVRLDGYMP